MVQAANSVEMLARKNCASILLAYQSKSSKPPLSIPAAIANNLDRPFKCKDCSRKFATFQALGGHRASHMKHRSSPSQHSGEFSFRDLSVQRFKLHDCKLCRERFPTGQALGGHMRKHAEFSRKRAAALDASRTFPVELKKKVVLQFDLNFPPPVDDSFLQLT